MQDPLPAPKAKADGRGEAMDGQQPDYARSYVRDPFLHAEVIQYRRWQWNAMYSSLDAKAKSKPDYLDTYRLQADAYQVNATYSEALSQLEVLPAFRGDHHVRQLRLPAADRHEAGSHCGLWPVPQERRQAVGWPAHTA
ncbi:MAG: hypothetical protein L0G49_07920 [Luteococcus sp.]|uniref:hypothetical protein n=1 Tax=Luteococcus sp. TaxID=1969402 RepID=UPI0026478135|nr:hypothetical protein [Luteococcus sp.]MDN5563684.1 hypothetical protein [Luteococcus sp.]